MLRAWVCVVLVTGVAAALDETRADASYGIDVQAERAAVSGPDGRTEIPRGSASSVSDGRAISPPVAVEAPAVGLSAPLTPVGKSADGALAVPDFGTAGWYHHSVPPGAPGAAVLAGHVDSTTGPDVFFALGDLEPGDTVLVRHQDGTTSTFVVDRREITDKDELPVERIFDDPARPELRLITCGGEFDRSERSYESNVIIYAHLVPPQG